MKRSDPFEVFARALLWLFLAGGIAFVCWLLWLVWLSPNSIGPQ